MSSIQQRHLLRFFLSAVCLLTFSSVGWADAPTPPQPPAPKQAQDQKPQPSPDLRQTLILPIRYVDGYRLADLLHVFIPKHQRDVDIRYSPALHKLLLRAQPDQLPLLKRAAEQMDTPQVQFGVWLYVAAHSIDTFVGSSSVPPAVLAAFREIDPDAQRLAPLDQRYLQVTNHERSQIKLSNRTALSAPLLHLTLHQAPSPKAPIVASLQIFHHELAGTSLPEKPGTKLATSIRLQTKLMIRPGAFTVVGHLPWYSEKSYERAVLLIRVKRLESESTPVASSSSPPLSPAPPPGLGKEAISSVIRENSVHFKLCYEAGLVKRPSMKGRIIVSFAIQTDGSVAEAKIASSSLLDQAVEDCILQRFRSFRFPKPAQGGVVRVNYPLTFHP